MKKKVTARDIIDAMSEADLALQRMLRDADKPCCWERMEQYKVAVNNERDLLRSYNNQF